MTGKARAYDSSDALSVGIQVPRILLGLKGPRDSVEYEDAVIVARAVDQVIDRRRARQSGAS
ncbi:hypothetical protein D5S17_32715 [Pseudonocardiaceae bacterium YIM PH 21723]|nr:hypothetical protein D5S17_32715 [Pseudonocardiaceae bacterium YIM PH 21723]